MTKPEDPRLVELMRKLREQTIEYTRSLGFELDQLVEFTPEACERDGWPRGQIWTVTGSIGGYGRIELDTHPRSGTYASVEAADLMPAATPT